MDVQHKKDKWYKTSFSPPKKEKSRNGQLSDNIKKFLAKKEEEEREKQLQAEVKKQELLALRNQDKSSVRRVNRMLKTTKSANKSLVSDTERLISVSAAENTQPDEDDYGFVSEQASDLYNKLLNKYNETVEKETKRVQEENIEKQKRSGKDENRAVHVFKETPQSQSSGFNSATNNKKDSDIKKDSASSCGEKKIRRPPPPVDFQTLLKLAEKVQHEPVTIKKVSKIEEEPSTEKYLFQKAMDRSNKKRKDIYRRERKRSDSSDASDEPRTVPKVPVPRPKDGYRTERSISDSSDVADEPRVLPKAQSGSKSVSRPKDIYRAERRDSSDVAEEHKSAPKESSASKGVQRHKDIYRTEKRMSDSSNTAQEPKRVPKVSSTSKSVPRPKDAYKIEKRIADSSDMAEEPRSVPKVPVMSKSVPKPKDVYRSEGTSQTSNVAKSVPKLQTASKSISRQSIPSSHDVNYGSKIKNDGIHNAPEKKKSLNLSPKHRNAPNNKSLDLSATKHSEYQSKKIIPRSNEVSVSRVKSEQPQASYAKLDDRLNKKAGCSYNTVRENNGPPRPIQGQKKAPEIVKQRNVVPEKRELPSSSKKPAIVPRSILDKRPSFPPSRFPPPKRPKYREETPDDEYDSEMDDFIDDTEETNDYSKYISEIFGYDRSRYQNVEDEDEEECMESNFSQLQKEEFISTKYGILEDLADIRQKKKEKERKQKKVKK